jgi:iron complex transport system substrate-binding protein
MDNLGVEVELGTAVKSLPEYLNKYNKSFDAGTLKEPNIEAIYEFDPDVIIISGRQEAAYNDLNTIAPTIYVEVGADTYLEDVKKNVELVAKVFGVEESSSTKMNEINALVDSTSLLAVGMEEKALIILVNGDTMSVYGRGSRFGIIHDVLNVKVADPNIDVATHGQSIDYEYITNINPDIIFVIDRNAVVSGSPSTDLLNNQILENVKAIKNNRVEFLDAVAWYIVTGGITSTTIMVNEIHEAISK